MQDRPRETQRTSSIQTLKLQILEVYYVFCSPGKALQTHQEIGESFYTFGFSKMYKSKSKSRLNVHSHISVTIAGVVLLVLFVCLYVCLFVFVLPRLNYLTLQHPLKITIYFYFQNLA